MTVIVGIYCRNGVVLASDSALTLNGQIEQPYPYKLSRIQNNFLTGFAGDLGYAQRIDYIFKKFSSSPGPLSNQSDPVIQWDVMNCFEVATALSQSVINNYLQTNINNIPHNIPTSILAAFSNVSGHYLVCFQNGTFQPLFFDEKNPFCSIGNGLLITNPILGFLKSVFWPRETLTINDGIFAAIMSLDLAIQINPGGINGPICVGILENINGQYSASLLDDDLLQEHLTNAQGAIDHFRAYRAQFNNES